MNAADDKFRSPRQRLSRFVHRFKALHRAKARQPVDCLATFVPPGGTILDIGAHFGYFAKEFCRLHSSSCEVYCFEPLSYNHSILVDVLAHKSNSHISRYALSDHAGQDEIYVPLKTSGNIGPGLAHMGKEHKRDFVVEKITTITLDEWVAENGIKALDFIKCDVEGAELLVFNGATASLKKFRPVLFCEVDENYTARLGYTPRELFGFLHALGYESYSIDFSQCLIEQTKVFKKNADYVFKPGR